MRPCILDFDPLELGFHGFFERLGRDRSHLRTRLQGVHDAFGIA